MLPPKALLVVGNNQAIAARIGGKTYEASCGPNQLNYPLNQACKAATLFQLADAVAGTRRFLVCPYLRTI